MPAASDVTRLLDDIEARQQNVIEELDALLARIEAVIAEYTPAKQADPSTAAAQRATSASEPVEPGMEDETTSDEEPEVLVDQAEDQEAEESTLAPKPRRRKSAA